MYEYTKHTLELLLIMINSTLNKSKNMIFYHMYEYMTRTDRIMLHIIYRLFEIHFRNFALSDTNQKI